MSAESNRPNEISEFERKLMKLRPSTSLDRERTMFEAGEAKALARVDARWKRWRAVTGLATAACVALTCCLIGTIQNGQRLRQSEIALRTQLAEALDSTNVKDEQAEQSPRSRASDVLPVDLKVEVARVPGNSQYNMRREALGSGLVSVSDRAARRLKSKPFSLGEARRVLAMAGAGDVGMRRIEALSP